MAMKDLSVTLCGIRLDNPVIPASGTFGFGIEMKDVYDLDILGAISLKGTTRDARFGNPCPRIAECEGGLINSVGLQNPGIEALVGEKVPELRKFYNKPVIANISGFSEEDYAFCAAKADACEGIDIIEVNVSCPNVCQGGKVIGSDAKMTAEVTKAVKSVTKKIMDIEEAKAQFNKYADIDCEIKASYIGKDDISPYIIVIKLVPVTSFPYDRTLTTNWEVSSIKQGVKAD